MDPRTTYDGQTKFNFYLVALAFSILGLAIQSFDRKTGGLPRVLELVAWAMLLFPRSSPSLMWSGPPSGRI